MPRRACLHSELAKFREIRGLPRLWGIIANFCKMNLFEYRLFIPKTKLRNFFLMILENEN